MTERAGGSDVSVTETKARPVFESSDPSKSGSTWELDGFKWCVLLIEATVGGCDYEQ